MTTDGPGDPASGPDDYGHRMFNRALLALGGLWLTFVFGGAIVLWLTGHDYHTKQLYLFIPGTVCCGAPAFFFLWLVADSTRRGR